MNQLRQLMLEELRRRNFADTTVRCYLHGVAHFSRYFRRPPDQLGPQDIRKYQAMLFTKLKFSPNTVILRPAALRFFYIHVLKRGWSIAETPYPKKVRHLPGVLSQEEVGRLIDAADSPFHRILLMTLYDTGARRAEAAHLKVNDIDSQRMVVHKAGANIGAVCDAIHHRQAEVGIRRIMGVLSLAKKYGCSACDQACAAALEFEVTEYRFVRCYLERSPQAPLSLRQIDPLIRDLTQYRDFIQQRIQFEESKP